MRSWCAGSKRVLSRPAAGSSAVREAATYLEDMRGVAGVPFSLYGDLSLACLKGDTSELRLWFRVVAQHATTESMFECVRCVLRIKEGYYFLIGRGLGVVPDRARTVLVRVASTAAASLLRLARENTP